MRVLGVLVFVGVALAGVGCHESEVTAQNEVGQDAFGVSATSEETSDEKPRTPSAFDLQSSKPSSSPEKGPRGIPKPVQMPMRQRAVNKEDAVGSVIPPVTQAASHSWPKADVDSPLTYDDGSNKVVVEGVCRVQEDEVSCWDANGSKAPDLSAKVKESITKSSSSYQPTLAFRYGKKNRLIVWKVVRQTSSESASATSVNVISAGNSVESDLASYGIQLNYQGTNHSSMSGDFTTYGCKAVSEAGTEKSTRLRLGAFTRFEQMVTLDCKVGAKAQLAGFTVKVDSINPGSRYATPRTTGEKVWSIGLKVAGAPANMSTMIQALGEDGKFLQYRDQDGKPVSAERFQKEMQEKMAAAHETGGPRSYNLTESKFSWVMQSTMRDKDIFYLQVGIDPKYISKLSVGGGTMKTIEITGIPLDPKS